MSVKTIIFLLIIIVSIGFLVYNIKRLISYLKIAKPENRFNNVGQRIAQTLKIALAQTKILREGSAGVIHIAIFWGFLVLLFSATESVIQGFFPSFTWGFLGPIFTLITLFTDIFCLAIIIAIIFAFIRRFIVKVPRLQGDQEEAKDATIVLSSIFIIVFSLLLQNSALTVIHPYEDWALRPISAIIGNLLSYNTSLIFVEVFWWLHILMILAFINYLPYSKHLHVYTSIPNVYFSSLKPVNKLDKIDFEQEGVEKFGVVDIEDLTWKNIFDSYSCTHCGRCTSVCPANTTGKELSPREIIVNIRERTADFAPILLLEKEFQSKQDTNASQSEITLNQNHIEIKDKKFIGDYESIEALWQCTTCGACMQECPVTIEHIPPIIGMRRSLVMMEANFPALLQNAFSNLENNATPWAFSSSERADWAEGTGIKIAAENPDFDVLFWVGCAGSFDDRAKKISLAFSKLMQIAGIDFAILGNEEQCNGDVARRTGNEYLADMLVKANVETLSRYNFKRIVTICPHCFNTLKNEYPDFGASYEVMHHSEFLAELIAQGKLKPKSIKNGNIKMAYHDSCYLGRYNNIYDAPRKVLQSIPGITLSEPKKTKDRGFCCGAGGGQMFMEETVGKRVNIERTEELLESNPQAIGLNCPFCMTMITDGVKAKEKIDEIQVKDIAEILLENIEE